MKVGAVLTVAGIVLIVFGVVLFTTGGCRTAQCRPSIQAVATFAGLGLVLAGIIRAGVPWVRSLPANATRGELALVAATIGVVVIGFWWWATTAHARNLVAG